jgi:hypothetical protein
VTLDHSTVGNALKLMVSCVTMTLIKVKFKLRGHLTELMVFAANQDSLENIAITMELTLAVNLQMVEEMVLVMFLLKEKIIKCLLFVLVLEIKKLVELAMMRKTLT